MIVRRSQFYYFFSHATEPDRLELSPDRLSRQDRSIGALGPAAESARWRRQNDCDDDDVLDCDTSLTAGRSRSCCSSARQHRHRQRFFGLEGRGAQRNAAAKAAPRVRDQARARSPPRRARKRGVGFFFWGGGRRSPTATDGDFPASPALGCRAEGRRYFLGGRRQVSLSTTRRRAIARFPLFCSARRTNYFCLLLAAMHTCASVWGCHL